MIEQLHLHFSLSCIGEGNGNPLQYCCLENPRDREPSGVAQSQTRLKQLSSRSSKHLLCKMAITFSLRYNSKVKVKVQVAQLCPTLYDPMDYTVHGILQVRMLEWVAFPFLRGSSQPSDRTQVSLIAGGVFTS